ncbi:hypothetical protein L1987_09365 [Smallanthus sonchifolius]|uniref:Uncharacterized protein n=1 Tax=Smallanthus sonchifolius TaxID=185202 RepID=A0ACB9JPJ5_9ASTR|nr:hypothetical protein L1987_09365 [Smallanthus sonchifolius]
MLMCYPKSQDMGINGPFNRNQWESVACLFQSVKEERVAVITGTVAGTLIHNRKAVQGPDASANRKAVQSPNEEKRNGFLLYQ